MTNLVSGIPSFSWINLKMVAENSLLLTSRGPMSSTSMWAAGSVVPPNASSWSGNTATVTYYRGKE